MPRKLRREPPISFHGDFLGGLMLADISEELDDWLARTRMSAREMASAAARAMRSRRPMQEKAAAALYWARRTVSLAPDDEAAARSLMELLWQAGDRTGALRAFETVRRHLETQLDVGPDARTLSLVRRIRARGAAATRTPAHDSGAATPAADPPGSRRIDPVVAPPALGRKATFARASCRSRSCRSTRRRRLRRRLPGRRLADELHARLIRLSRHPRALARRFAFRQSCTTVMWRRCAPRSTSIG
jgi:hypothetical protein